MSPEVPTPEPVPLNNPDPEPGDPKPKAPPAPDDEGRRVVPVELPGKPHAPESVRSCAARGVNFRA
jgi:hypothetical protein